VTLRDYNGTGKWSASAVLERYRELSARLGVETPLDLTPAEARHGEDRWIFPVMDKVIAGIELGDPACIALGVEFLEEDRKFPFGSNLKYRTARALRRAHIPPSSETRLRRRIVSMLALGNVPREYREYARLLRRIGFDEWWPRIEEKTPRNNPYAMRYYRYFRGVHDRSPSMVPREG
jgi:hypothetical protein